MNATNIFIIDYNLTFKLTINSFNQKYLTLIFYLGGYPQIFCVKLRVGSREFVGEGQTAQAAKHNAAGKALKLLKEVPIPDGQSKLDPTSQPFTPGMSFERPMDLETGNKHSSFSL